MTRRPASYTFGLPHDWVESLRALKRWFAIRVDRFERSLLPWGDAVLRALVPTGNANGEALIVRLDAIGDFILWLDAAKESRRLLPDRRLVLLANAIWAGVAQKMPHWDEVIAVDVARFSRLSGYRFRMLSEVRRRGFAAAMQPTYSRVPVVGDAFVRASDAATRIGSVGDASNMSPRQKRTADRVYTRLVPASPGLLTEIERNAEFVAFLTQAPFEPACAVVPVLGPLPEALRVEGPYLVVFPGASADFRQWPARRFAEAANALNDEAALTVVLCGSAGERALCDEVASMLRGRVVNVAGRTALWEFVEIVRGARLLIGNETSAVHVAAAVATPSVCILGGGHYGRFMPYGDRVARRAASIVAIHPMPCFGCNWKCTQPHRPGDAVPCVAGVSVADVVRASREAWPVEDRLLRA